MPDRYDFANLSPIEFESLCVDLISAETNSRFERFSEGPDGGMDGRYSKDGNNSILQAKHYRNSTWADLQKATKKEAKNIIKLNPFLYYLLTSQPLTPDRKDKLSYIISHQSASPSNIWGRAELNALLAKHPDVEKANTKLWLSSTAVLERILKNDIAIFTEATREEIERILKVFVTNPSVNKSEDILSKTHCLIISGPPGAGKTTLAQILAAKYSGSGWELVSIASIKDGLSAFHRNKRQIFVYDDFLGKIKLDPTSLSQNDGNIVRFMSLFLKTTKRDLYSLLAHTYYRRLERSPRHLTTEE